MKQDKGFTLIELLATVIILGIVLVIAIPAVNNIISDARQKAYNKTVENIVKAAELYTLNELSLLRNLKEDGDFVEITLQELVDKGYIENNIINPITREQLNFNGNMVKITYNNENYDYEFKPTHIRTGLVADYRFDDFQEPTINHIIDGNFLNSLFRAPYSNVGSSGILEFISGYAPTGGNILKHTAITNDSYTFPYFGVGSRIVNAIPGEIWTASIYVRAEQNNTPVQIYIFPIDSSDSPWIIANWAHTIANVSKEWMRISVTHTMPVGTTGISVRVDNDGGSGAIVYWNGWQLEKKPYPTTFTNGTRTGVVQDYSNNNYNANLTMQDTPRWIYNEERKSGVYSFNNKTITFGTGNTFFPLNNFSISAWIKTPGLGSGMTLNGIISITYGLTVYLNSSGNLNFRMDNGTAVPAIVATRPLHDNQFHHILVSFDGVNKRIYINGVLMITSPFSGWTGFTRWPTNSAVIGQENNNGPIYRFNGIIDDVRIYNRALTAQEVLHNYNAER